jgi:hypothetical protein
MIEHAEEAADLTYILPLKLDDPAREGELGEYLQWVNQQTELIVIDGSAPDAFRRHAQSWPGIRHVAPDPSRYTINGKVWGVITGLSLAGRDKVIVADDDVRYDDASLDRMSRLLDNAEVVRPQNYFEPAPWHAKWDGARSLINRLTGGDWPGTLGVRRSALPDGYDGNCLFENLEMVRTVVAGGGRELIAQDLYIRRLPPPARHFLSQRVRQAYDEWARPGRYLVQLSLLPAIVIGLTRNRTLLAGLIGVSIAAAETGRRKQGAQAHFSPAASLLAPLWLAERATCSWMALAMRLVRGGAIYHGTVISRPATPMRELRRRFGQSTRGTMKGTVL